jgi:hypothetical protein
MPNAVEGWHIGGLAGCWPGALMPLGGLCCFLASASAA